MIPMRSGRLEFQAVYVETAPEFFIFPAQKTKCNCSAKRTEFEVKTLLQLDHLNDRHPTATDDQALDGRH